MMGNEAMARPWFPDVFPTMDRTSPTAISPMAPKTSTLYDVEAVAQNCSSTVQVYVVRCGRVLRGLLCTLGTRNTLRSGPHNARALAGRER